MTANNPVPKKQCYKKPRKVCQTLVSTKPKVVTAKVPREVCDHSIKHTSSSQAQPGKPSSVINIRPSPKIPTQSTSASQIINKKIYNQNMNPNNRLLEDLAPVEYDLDRGYHELKQ